MYKKLREAESERNEDQIYSIKAVLNRMKKHIKNAPENKKSMIEENEKMTNIVEQGQGLKILTPNQMLSRLPISLASLKAGNNSEKLKNEIRRNCILCTDQKNLQNNAIKV